jgi:hypothetical protein
MDGQCRSGAACALTARGASDGTLRVAGAEACRYGERFDVDSRFAGRYTPGRI